MLPRNFDFYKFYKENEDEVPLSFPDMRYSNLKKWKRKHMGHNKVCFEMRGILISFCTDCDSALMYDYVNPEKGGIL